MKYDYTVIQDGQTYLAGEDVPEMGSLICVKKYGNIRDYEGLSKDIDKLPLYVGTGSSCLMTDTGDAISGKASGKGFSFLSNGKDGIIVKYDDGI